MARPKSSSLARIDDLAKALRSEVYNAMAEYNILLAGSERLKEIEPALRKLQTALNPPVTGQPAVDQPPTEPQPGDLCKLIPESIPDNHPTRKRAKHIRKLLVVDDATLANQD